MLAVRKPGVPAIRISSPPPVTAIAAARTESVLEIINDDMPFLLDSVLGELAERGFAIRFVVHPVFSVARDGDGRLLALKGMHNASGALRESFIHIHFDRVDDVRAAETVAALERVLDGFEDVADEIEGIVIDHA